jgi:WD40 repeat protein
VCWSPDGQRLASAGEDHAVKVWDAARGQEARTLRGHTGAVTSVCWSPDGQRLASAGEDGTVMVWDAENGQKVHTLKGHTKSVTSVCWSPDGTRLASAARRPATEARMPGDTKVKVSEKVKVWDAQTGQEILTLQEDTYWVKSVCWSPDGQRLATDSGYRVRVWDGVSSHVNLSAPLGSPWGHTSAVQSVCWSPDGQRLASASLDQTVKVWDAATRREVLSFQGHTGGVFSVCWSPDGKRLASGSGVHDAGGGEPLPGEVKVWDAVTGQETLTLKGHTGKVFSVCWSPDGQRLASASEDSTVKVWDATPPAEPPAPRK